MKKNIFYYLLLFIIACPLHLLCQETSVTNFMPNSSTVSLPWTPVSGRGIGLGLDIFGNATAEEEDINLMIPFNDYVAIRIRPVLYEGFSAGVNVGSKVEGMVRSEMILNCIRVYGGGGVALFYGLTGTDAGGIDGNWFAGDINGNWFLGTEIFFTPYISLHWEFGTSGGAFETGQGSYVSAGIELYPWDN